MGILMNNLWRFEDWWNSHVYYCKHEVAYDPENDQFDCSRCPKKFKRGSLLYSIALPLLKMSDDAAASLNSDQKQKEP